MRDEGPLEIEEATTRDSCRERERCVVVVVVGSDFGWACFVRVIEIR